MTDEDLAAAHERGLAELVVRAKRERYREQLASTKRRMKFTERLPHFYDWDPAHIVAIPAEHRYAAAILHLLFKRGAGERCWPSTRARIPVLGLSFTGAFEFRRSFHADEEPT